MGDALTSAEPCAVSTLAAPGATSPAATAAATRETNGSRKAGPGSAASDRSHRPSMYLCCDIDENKTRILGINIGDNKRNRVKIYLMLTMIRHRLNVIKRGKDSLKVVSNECDDVRLGAGEMLLWCAARRVDSLPTWRNDMMSGSGGE